MIKKTTNKTRLIYLCISPACDIPPKHYGMFWGFVAKGNKPLCVGVQREISKWDALFWEEAKLKWMLKRNGWSFWYFGTTRVTYYMKRHPIFQIILFTLERCLLVTGSIQLNASTVRAARDCVLCRECHSLEVQFDILATCFSVT